VSACIRLVRSSRRFSSATSMPSRIRGTLRRHEFGFYFLTDKDGNAIVNPYARPDEMTSLIRTWDVEDFLLTC
jgi:hypothetical protein